MLQRLLSLIFASVMGTLCFNALASSEELFLNRFLKSQVPITTVMGVRAYCEKKVIKTCDIHAVVSKDQIKITWPKRWPSQSINPTTLLCNQLGGESSNGYSKTVDQIPICRFKDGSFILTWDLFKKHNINILDPKARSE